LETATGARRQPLTIFLTTAGYDRQSPCFKTWERAEKIRDGVLVDDTFLPCIYAAGQDADPFDPETWRAANPNFGVTIKEDYFEQMSAKARESAADEMTFRRLHLNQWTSSEEKFFRHGAWEACATPNRPASGRPCFCGLDLASTYDTTAFVAVWPDTDGSFDVQAMFWIPEENADKREKQDRVPYTQWVRDGFVRLTDGDITDYDQIRDYILEFCEKNWVKGIAVDRWNAVHLMTQLSAEGQTVHPFGQGFGPLNAPTRMLENLVISGRIRHAGNPVLSWQASNVQVKTNEDGLIKPVKKSSHDVGRIDGIVACIMALSLASGETYGPQPEPELLVL
jgi:phage terminase large subunit-like protein